MPYSEVFRQLLAANFDDIDLVIYLLETEIIKRNLTNPNKTQLPTDEKEDASVDDVWDLNG